MQPTQEKAAHELLANLRQLRKNAFQQGKELYDRWQPMIDRRVFCLSGANLAQYLALRQQDLRPLQTELMAFGLSSLGRSEGRVLPNLDAVITTLEAICREPNPQPYPPIRSFFRGERLLHHNADELFGTPPKERKVRVMVTFPTEAATDYAFVLDLMQRGMDVARINCAHDTEDVWAAMVENVKRARADVGRECRILMDLGGPKPRTLDLILKEKRLHRGDTLLLMRENPEESDQYPNQVRCSIPEVIDQLSAGDEVWIDDGKIGTQVESILPEGALLRVTTARDKGERLREEKGLNFPTVDLKLSPLTDDDLKALDFVAVHADMIGYSFVQSADDVQLLQRQLLARRSDPHKIAIIAKIETRRAIHNLPEIIVAAAGQQPFGVMIARGDLAIEVGYERMAEIQEEILWLCEAAHVPVIWATQVLESFIRKGTPSRGEMTDAAMSVRAECVMLNKGPYVGEAISRLNDLLSRMQEHQTKKTPQLRALKSWRDLFD